MVFELFRNYLPPHDSHCRRSSIAVVNASSCAVLQMSFRKETTPMLHEGVSSEATQLMSRSFYIPKVRVQCPDLSLQSV